MVDAELSRFDIIADYTKWLIGTHVGFLLFSQCRIYPYLLAVDPVLSRGNAIISWSDTSADHTSRLICTIIGVSYLSQCRMRCMHIPAPCRTGPFGKQYHIKWNRCQCISYKMANLYTCRHYLIIQRPPIPARCGCGPCEGGYNMKSAWLQCRSYNLNDLYTYRRQLIIPRWCIPCLFTLDSVFFVEQYHIQPIWFYCKHIKCYICLRVASFD